MTPLDVRLSQVFCGHPAFRAAPVLKTVLRKYSGHLPPPDWDGGGGGPALVLLPVGGLPDVVSLDGGDDPASLGGGEGDVVDGNEGLPDVLSDPSLVPVPAPVPPPLLVLGLEISPQPGI